MTRTAGLPRTGLSAAVPALAESFQRMELSWHIHLRSQFPLKLSRE
jgi:hypothetical protein